MPDKGKAKASDLHEAAADRRESSPGSHPIPPSSSQTQSPAPNRNPEHATGEHESEASRSQSDRRDNITDSEPRVNTVLRPQVSTPTGQGDPSETVSHVRGRDETRVEIAVGKEREDDSDEATGDGNAGGQPALDPDLAVHRRSVAGRGSEVRSGSRDHASDSPIPNIQIQPSTSSGTPTSTLPTPATVTPSSAPIDISTSLPNPDPSAPPPLMPSDLLPILHCLYCSSLLSYPTTLHCGHTVCARHVRSPTTVASKSPSHPHPHSLIKSLLHRTASPSPTRPPPSSQPSPPQQPDQPRPHRPPIVPSCPLPSCRPSPSPLHAAPAINIPSSSKVAYFPAPQTESPQELIRVPDPKLDVAVSKVLNLVVRAQDWCEQEFVPSRGDAEGTDGESDDSEGSDEDLYLDEEGPSSPTRTPPPRHPRKRDSADRPRKRRRRRFPRHHPPPHPNVPPEPTNLAARFEKELMSELTCEICFVLLYQPITTPCQHTFCNKCLQRSLDHSVTCPVCRQDLPGFAYFQDHAHNKVLLTILLKAFPAEYADRRRSLEEEERNTRLDTPIFICQLSFPGMPTLLHFYEPRYRLMLRRCLESPNPRFGMIMPPRAGGANGAGTDFGTMLEIRSVQMLPDGRSMVETWGVWRFRILERGIVDGYLAGRIERIDDYPVELDSTDLPLPIPSPSSSLRATTPPIFRSPAHPTSPNQPIGGTVSTSSLELNNDDLMTMCHGFLDQLRQGTAPWVVQRLNNTYGPMPTDPADFSFWMALVLPIDEHEKSKLLPIRSPRLRLRLVVHWIEQLNSNWWFSSGCVIL
ncbi:hypothetical protein JAAARDRAFT_28161 [Jaapia argillacea MUCL 33604]|uniref:RING-type domain-containing protein n=1 Tax=Jaapia argillacea MUCL 33604 TaxID=933084 RepID=A0A067QLZ3_9AGAM|nr:hypothetical protein JAAARDRAFT_28161 [Jaapia argillacea MUCL 33604]